MRLAAPLCISFLALALAACGDSDSPETAPDDVSSHMQEHFDKVMGYIELGKPTENCPVCQALPKVFTTVA